MGSLKQWWHIFSTNKSTLFGGILPITILITILGCFSLLYSNSIKILDHIFEVSNYSLILKQNTSETEVDKLYREIKKNFNIINAEKVTPTQAKKELLEAFDKINTDLLSLELNKFPYVIEFTLKTNKTESKKFIQELKNNTHTYNLISGLDSSSQIEILFFVIRILGGFFLLLLATSVFYIVNHSIQVVFFNLKKEIEVLLILGATARFIYTPFMFNGFLITTLGCLLGALVVYVIFLFTVTFLGASESLSLADLSLANFSWENLFGADFSLANFSWANLFGADFSWANFSWANLFGANLFGADSAPAGSSFVGEVAVFFKPDFLLYSFLTLVFIGLISSWSAIYNVIQKIEITS